MSRRILRVQNRPKRLNITLTPEVLAALSELSEVSGIAAASFVSTLMSDALPVVQAMIKAFQEARKAPLRAADTMDAVTHSLMASAAQESLAFRERATTQAALRKTTRKRK